MTHLIRPINLELIIKLTAGTLLSATIIATGANAINTGIEAEDNLHLEHKLWLEENSNSVYDNDISLDEYEASQRAKEIADANASLAKIKAYADGGSK